MLYIPKGEEDDERTIAVPMQLLPILKRALPLKVNHRKVFESAMMKVTGVRKFGRRDFRACFLSSQALGDVFGAHKVAGHKGAVMERYHNMPDARKAAVAVAVWQAFFPDIAPSGPYLVPNLGPNVGPEAYFRKRLKLEDAK
jgi:hypothetical protein